jgi:hypothetical protein
MSCLSKLAVTKENKLKIIESGLMAVFKLILNNHATNASNTASGNEELSNTLTCIWNLCFDEKICELFKKEKEILSLINNIKNSSSAEDIQKKAAGILFTLNDLQKKSKGNCSQVIK